MNWAALLLQLISGAAPAGVGGGYSRGLSG